MKKYKVSFIQARIIGYDWDDLEKISSKFFNLLKGLDLKKEKINIKYDKGRGLISSQINVYSCTLNKAKHIKIFLKNLFENHSKEDIKKILENANFDDKYNIYLRFDKNSFIYENKLNLVQHGDVLHIKISCDLPKKDKEKVINEILKTFETNLNKKEERFNENSKKEDILQKKIRNLK